MNRTEIFERLTWLEKNVESINQNMSELKTLAVELVEENVALQIENENLQALIEKNESAKDTDVEQRNLRNR